MALPPQKLCTVFFQFLNSTADKSKTRNTADQLKCCLRRNNIQIILFPVIVLVVSDCRYSDVNVADIGRILHFDYHTKLVCKQIVKQKIIAGVRVSVFCFCRTWHETNQSC